MRNKPMESLDEFLQEPSDWVNDRMNQLRMLFNIGYLVQMEILKTQPDTALVEWVYQKILRDVESYDYDENDEDSLMFADDLSFAFELAAGVVPASRLRPLAQKLYELMPSPDTERLLRTLEYYSEG